MDRGAHPRRRARRTALGGRRPLGTSRALGPAGAGRARRTDRLRRTRGSGLRAARGLGAPPAFSVARSPQAVSAPCCRSRRPAWGFPRPSPGLAGGGRSRQGLALAMSWAGTSDRLSLLVLAGRRTESPDCFRCTEFGRAARPRARAPRRDWLGPRARSRRRPRPPPLPGAPERGGRSPGTNGRAQPPGPLALDHRWRTRPARRGDWREHTRGGTEPRPAGRPCPRRARPPASRGRRGRVARRRAPRALPSGCGALPRPRPGLPHRRGAGLRLPRRGGRAGHCARRVDPGRARSRIRCASET